MSDIIRAREELKVVLANLRDRKVLIQNDIASVKRALRFMVRQSPIRRAPAKREVISDRVRDRVIALAKNKRLTTHEIAVKVGLRNGGRVSEILHGAR